MPILTVDVPDELYTSAMRMIADLIETGPTQRGALDLDHDPHLEDHHSAVWTPLQMIPAEGAQDINVLLALYLKLSESGRKALDLLALTGGMHQDELAEHLGVGGASGLAGLIGHITKTAAALGKDSPVARDASTKQYAIKRGLLDPIRNVANHAMTPHARLNDHASEPEVFWGYDDEPIYEHVFPYAGKWWSFKRGRPLRYLDLGSDMAYVDNDMVKPIEYRTHEEAEADNHELFEESYWFFEFFPDHDLGLLVGHTPVTAGAPVWPHDEDTLYATSGWHSLRDFEDQTWPKFHPDWKVSEIPPPEGF